MDAQGEPLAGIVVKVFAEEKGKLQGYAVTDAQGHYEITLPTGREATYAVMAGIGFRQVERRIEKGTNDLGRITMEEADVELKEVTVKAPPVRTSGDTIAYNVDQLKDKSDRTIEDVIKKIPGVEVDKQGRIKYQGEDINKFYIEGLDMLGGRYTLATQNIQPDDIATISVYENHQPKRVMQGFEYSKHAALNLTMKRSSMLRPIVNTTLGAGYGETPLWLAEGTGLFIAPRKQFLLTAKTNNAGSFYEKESVNFFASELFPSPLAWGLLKSATPEGSRLSRDRYADNRSATGSLNGIQKLGEDRTLSFNGGYFFNRLTSRQSQTSEYWQEGTAAIITQEAFRNHDEQHRGWLTLRYEHNGKRNYLSEELNVEGNLSRLTDKVTGDAALRQRVKSDRYGVDNRINAVWRRGNKLFMLNSDVAVAQVPCSNLLATDSQSDSLLVGQDVEGLKFRTTESTSYGWTLGKYSTLTLNARIQSEYDRLAAESAEADGLYSGFTVRTAAYPKYMFQTERAIWEVSLPLQMLDMRYTERRADRSYSRHRPTATLSTSFSYRPNKFLRLGLGGDAIRTLGEMRDIVEVPIHTTYRNTNVLGSGLFQENDRFSAKGSASYRNPLHGSNYMLDAQYQYGRSNRTGGSNVSPTATQNTWSNTRSTSGMWLVNFRAAKNLLGHGTVLTASANLASLKSQSLRQGTAYHLANHTLTLRGNVHSTLLGQHLILDIDLIYALSAQKIDLTQGKNTRNEITPSVRLSVLPAKAWEIYARAFMGYVEKEQGGYDDNFYLDAGVRYTHKRFEAELSGKNLANRRDYTLRRYASFDRFTYRYHLRPREVMLVFRLALKKK